MPNINVEQYIERKISEYEKNPQFVADGLALKVSDQVVELLESKGMTQTKLAERMGVSRSHVSSILNAPPNMTLLTLARLAIALEVQPRVYLDTNIFIGTMLGYPSPYEDDAIDKKIILLGSDTQGTTITTRKVHNAVG